MIIEKSADHENYKHTRNISQENVDLVTLIPVDMVKIKLIPTSVSDHYVKTQPVLKMCRIKW